MKDLNSVLHSVLEKIRPSPEEESKIQETIERAVSALRGACGEGVEVLPVGSAARGTHLKGTSDIDVFLVFPREVSREEMERALFDTVKRAFGAYETRYAEHPYARVKVNGFHVDVVPAYRIRPGERPISATDRSPLHQEYVSTHLQDSKKDDVRLLKAFLKGIGVYGAEIAVKGFSGYLSELLVIKYGSFTEVLREASRWKPQVIITLGNAPEKKFTEPLVVVDPVDPQRNVAAPVSTQSLAVFVAAAREFLRSPSEAFFFPEKEWSREEVRRSVEQRRTEVFAVVCEYPGESPDIVWGRIQAEEAKIRKLLEREGYKVINSVAWTDEEEKILLLFEVGAGRFSNVVKVTGPPVWDEKHSERFLEKHRGAFYGPWIEGERWHAEYVRPPRHPELLVAEYLAGKELFGGVEVVVGKEIAHIMDDKCGPVVYSFFLKRPHWLKR